MEDFPKINPNNTTNQGVSKDSSNLTQSLTSESSSNQSLKPQEDLRSTVSKQFSQKNAKIDGVTVNSKQQSTDIERERLRQVSQIENLINELNQGVITQDGKIQLVGFLKDNPNSSSISLITASFGVSSLSIFPPGKQISPGCSLRFFPLTSNITLGIPFISVNKIATEALFIVFQPSIYFSVFFILFVISSKFIIYFL